MLFLPDLQTDVQKYWRGTYFLLAERLNGSIVDLAREIKQSAGDVRGIITATGSQDARVNKIDWPIFFANDKTSISREEFASYLGRSPPELHAWMSKHDAAETSRVVATNFTEIHSLCNREVIAPRPQAWSSFEDKVVAQRLFDDLGIPTPHSVVVDVSSDLCKFITGDEFAMGAVIALDNSTGVRGDSHGLRWAQASGSGRLEAVAWARTHAKQVRISSFVDGIPCSVLGVVSQSGIAVMDPIEIVTLCDLRESRFIFAGWSNYWRPHPALAERIRSVGRIVGEALYREVRYRGFFSVDGLATKGEHFLATEINPRLASGLGVRAIDPQFPVYLLSRSLQLPKHVLAAWAPEQFESAIRSAVRQFPSFAISVDQSDRRAISSSQPTAPRKPFTLSEIDGLDNHGLLAPIVLDRLQKAGWKDLTSGAVM